MGMKLYYSVGGELLGESTGGVATTYMSDALGSTVGTITSAGVQNRYVYKPYGGTLAKTGAAADPKFMWNASSGYRQTERANADVYVRLRHLGFTAACWTSLDPLWPATQSPYGIPKVVTAADPWGLDPTLPWHGGYLQPVNPLPGLPIPLPPIFAFPPYIPPTLPPNVVSVVVSCPRVISGGVNAGGNYSSPTGGSPRPERPTTKPTPSPPPHSGNGCSTPGLVGACIAGLCSGTVSTKYILLLYGELGMFAGEKAPFPTQWAGLNPNPEPCCEAAWSGKGYDPIGISIGILCKKLPGAGEGSCVDTEQTADGCHRCCERNFPPNELYSRCDMLCTRKWGE